MSTEAWLQTLGWCANVIFLVGMWIMGDKISNFKRRLGVLLIALCNVLYFVQTYYLNNVSLCILTLTAAILQVRAYYNWK